MLDWMDGLGWDGISLNRLTTRSPYGDNKYPFGQERNVDLPIWIKNQVRFLEKEEINSHILDMWSVMLFYIIFLFYIMLEDFTTFLLYNSNHTRR